jgi:hypothetical protein
MRIAIVFRLIQSGMETLSLIATTRPRAMAQPPPITDKGAV